MTSEIRLLSLHQPWASLVALGLKKYETRSWATPYRGKIAIQAAKRWAKDDEVEGIYQQLRDFGGTSDDINKLDQLLANFLMQGDDLPYGAIVAVADLADCLTMKTIEPGKFITEWRSKEDGASYSEVVLNPLERAVGDWQPGRYAWQLENVRPIAQPIPCKGAQGLRRITDPAVLEAIESQGNLV